MIQTVPVLLLTGYLGSGKTTLVNQILTNQKGIRFAVIVNDIGEVNIDADLIQKGGVVNQKDDSLVALQNGCICCSLKMDLVEQLHDITSQHQFDYIVIEASGICEPAPIAQTICSIPEMMPQYAVDGLPRLDCIVSVVDALRMRDEFVEALNPALTDEPKDFVSRLEEEDLVSLVIQQIEFCNKILLNKASEVSPEELAHIKQIIRTIQPKAEIIDCDYCQVDWDKLLNTHSFHFDDVAGSAKWIELIESREEEDEHEHEHHHHDHDDHDDDDEEDHSDCDHEHGICHHHHHHHDHDHNHTEEYGIGSFVYYARRPFNLGMFDEFIARHFPKSVIRCKGMCYFADEYDMCYVFEQAGRQLKLTQAGQWYATMPKDELEEMMLREPMLQKDWDEQYGDRMQKLVFIGQNMNRAEITRQLDMCLQ